tara:strand:- start:2373 stop:2582 length:210 start_codon:yes stop_codon:yes gene_type:complete
MSNLKKKLSDQVNELASKDIGGDGELFDMTPEMHTIYVWALYNAPIRKLREWKKEFKQRHKEQEEQEYE